MPTDEKIGFVAAIKREALECFVHASCFAAATRQRFDASTDDL